jgi:hypothetical protein
MGNDHRGACTTSGVGVEKIVHPKNTSKTPAKTGIFEIIAGAQKIFSNRC